MMLEVTAHSWSYLVPAKARTGTPQGQMRTIEKTLYLLPKRQQTHNKQRLTIAPTESHSALLLILNYLLK